MDIAKEDIENLSADVDGWAKPLTFTAPTGEVVEITGIFAERNIEVLSDKGDGSTVNTVQANCGVSEKHLTDLGYPTRDDRNEVYLRGHKVQATNSAGVLNTYKIREWKADSTVGYIVCIFEAFTP